MSTLSILRFADFLTNITVDSAVLVVALTAYRRTNMRAFAFLFWGSVIGIILSVGLQLEHQTVRTSTDSVGFWEIYRLGYIAAAVLWGAGIVSLVRCVVSNFERKQPDVA